MLPFNKPHFSTTEIIGDSIQGCDSVITWNSTNQSFDISDYSTSWNNVYNTYVANAYMVNVDQDQMWPPDNNIYSKQKEQLQKVKSSVSALNTPRKVICHLQANDSTELIDTNDIEFDVYIKSRPDEIQSKDSNSDSKLEIIDGKMVIIANLGNFVTSWTSGNTLHIKAMQTSTGYEGNAEIILDNKANAILYGFEPEVVSTGNPIILSDDMSAPNIISIEHLAESTTLVWNSVTGADSYQVYSSDDPYNNFTLDTSGSFNDTTWTSTITQNKKFYYVVGINSSKEIIKKSEVVNGK